MQIAWLYPIGKHRNRCIKIYFHLDIWSEYCQNTTLMLSNNMVRPMKLRCVFNKVFLVKRDTLNCSYKWFSNSHRCID